MICGVRFNILAYTLGGFCSLDKNKKYDPVFVKQKLPGAVIL